MSYFSAYYGEMVIALFLSSFSGAKDVGWVLSPSTQLGPKLVWLNESWAKYWAPACLFRALSLHRGSQGVRERVARNWMISCCRNFSWAKCLREVVTNSLTQFTFLPCIILSRSCMKISKIHSWSPRLRAAAFSLGSYTRHESVW